jgi:hypothetical protein
MTRYFRSDLLRPREDLNIKSGLQWLQAAQNRYQAPIAPPDFTSLGYDVDMSAPAQTHGVDTLMHVGAVDFAGAGLIKPIAALLLAYHGYERNKGDPMWAAIWGLLGYWQPLYAIGAAAALGYAKPEAQSRFKLESMLGGIGSKTVKRAKARKNPKKRKATYKPPSKKARAARRRRSPSTLPKTSFTAAEWKRLVDSRRRRAKASRKKARK